MTTEPKMTQTERDALTAALNASYGGCRCMQGRTMCDGHALLREDGRIERLLWVRRTLPTWQRAEYLGRCSVCGEDGQHSVGDDRCLPCRTAAAAEQAKPFRLPW